MQACTHVWRNPHTHAQTITHSCMHKHWHAPTHSTSHEHMKALRHAHTQALERTDLKQMCDVDHVPLQYTQFHHIRVFEQIYTSTKLRTSRSSAVIAIWPYLSGILTSGPSMDHVWVGIIEYFLVHTPTIKLGHSTIQSCEVTKQDHLLAHIKWYQDHPQKYFMGNGIVLSATVPEDSTCSSFMPVSRIISRCAILHTKLQLEYGEDKVCIAIPMRRHYLL